MQNQVKILRLPNEHFLVNVPICTRREMKRFNSEFLKRLPEGAKVEEKTEVAKLKEAPSAIYYFHILTELSEEEIKSIANQSLQALRKEAKCKSILK